MKVAPVVVLALCLALVSCEERYDEGIDAVVITG